MRITVFIALWLFASAPALAQREVTTIMVNYASPEQVVAVIRPLLSPGSSVSAYQNRLVLNVTAEELARTREVLRQLDVMGRQLLVSLRTAHSGEESRRGVDVDSVIKSGDSVVTTKQKGRYAEEGTTVRVTNSRDTSTGDGNQAVRATEGIPAYIATGVAAPVATVSRGPDGRRYYQQDYLQAATGFYATTWVNDDIVRITIDQSDDALNGRTINTQQLRSEVSGAVGQWIPIGMISDVATRRDSGIASRTQSERTGSTQLFLKVELVE